MRLEKIIKEENRKVKRRRIRKSASKFLGGLLTSAVLLLPTYELLNSSFAQDSFGNFYQSPAKVDRTSISKVNLSLENESDSYSIPSRKSRENFSYSSEGSFKRVPKLSGNFSNRYSERGRFLRTYRWRKVISEAEKRYNLPRGILAGIIMEESMGNPLELNSRADGGAGLMMFQPGTAREYGLKTLGNSESTGIDRKQGEELAYLVRKEKYNLRKLGNIDERFNITKSVFAGARFLERLHQRYHSWNDAISAYNNGTPLEEARNTNYVEKVKNYQRIYEKIVR